MKYILNYNPISVQCRKLLVFMHEVRVEFELKKVKYISKINSIYDPTLPHPILIDQRNEIFDGDAACQYIHEMHNIYKNLYGSNASCRAEVRAMYNFLENKMYNEAVFIIINERIVKFIYENSSPDSIALNNSKKKIAFYLEYLDCLLDSHQWLVPYGFSIADISAAAQISILDYLNDVSWEKYARLKDWYAVIKSKPSFKAILNSRIQGFYPSRHYSDLDF
ncbi:MAG: glutathione S-transferase family protein [Anaplasmataceae bacterium]|nr:glutathione S-transferase family protein [Anaplasmataceae bacterium]